MKKTSMKDTHNTPAYRLGRITTVCPSCRRRRFKPYVDAAGQMLDPTCGRCNRECSCGYHLPPRQWFEQQGKRPPYSAKAPAARPQEWCRPSFVDETYVAATLGSWPNPLAVWMASLFGIPTVRRVWLDYCVGWSPKQRKVIWWLRDSTRQIRSGKLMAYGSDGHRSHADHDHPTWIHTLLRRTGRPAYASGEFRFRGCMFGEWPAATPQLSGARLLVMESEKSAIVVACRLWQLGAYGRWVSVATGGCGGLKADLTELCSDPWHRLACLRGRDVVLVPDADKVEEWTQHALTLRHVCRSIRVFDIRRSGATGSDDIADLIVRRLRA